VVDFQIATPSDVLQEILDRLSHHDMGDGQYDGERAIRLVDASYALHMAVIALDGVDLEQDPLSGIDTDPTADDSAGRTGAKPGVSSVEVERIGNELEHCVIHPIFNATLAMQSVLQRTDDPEIHRCIQDAIEELDDVIMHARRFVFDLNEAVD
jgi:hypothetical protein